jgi:lysophospholipase L1-like esterase
LIYGWLLSGFVLILILSSELIFRLLNKFKKSSHLKFDITKFTLIDKAFDQADSFINCEWYPDYKLEATKVFNAPIWAPFIYWKSKSVSGKYINVKRNLRATWDSKLVTHNMDIASIFCFGGSTMWGWGARDNHTVPSYIAKDCHVHVSNPVTVINYAQLGYVSSQCLITLITLLQRGIRPNLAVFYDGLNDIFSAYQAGIAGVAQNEFNRKFQFESTFKQKIYEQIQNRSYLCRSLKKIATQSNAAMGTMNPQKTFSIHPKTLARCLIDLYIENTKIISALGKQYGFRCLFYWQPVLFTKKKRSDFEDKVYKYHKFWEDFYNCTNDIFSEIDLPENIFNISDLFSNYREPLYIDPWHVNETGNRILASRMLENILPLISHP